MSYLALITRKMLWPRSHLLCSECPRSNKTKMLAEDFFFIYNSGHCKQDNNTNNILLLYLGYFIYSIWLFFSAQCPFVSSKRFLHSHPQHWLCYLGNTRVTSLQYFYNNKYQLLRHYLWLFKQVQLYMYPFYTHSTITRFVILPITKRYKYLPQLHR
jgi:hypothetical protein